MRSIYNSTETWVSENLDDPINKIYRKWLQLPIRSKMHLTLSKSSAGLKHQIYMKCNLSTRRILKIHQIKKQINCTSEDHVRSLKNVREKTIIKKALNYCVKITLKTKCQAY